MFMYTADFPLKLECLVQYVRIFIKNVKLVRKMEMNKNIYF
jgi:hypothetical protein